jgi:hypothetical protein
MLASAFAPATGREDPAAATADGQPRREARASIAREKKIRRTCELSRVAFP